MCTPRRVNPVKPLENVGQVFGRYAYTGISNGDPEPSVARDGGQNDITAGVRVFDSVVEQNQNQPPDAGLVRKSDRSGAVALDPDRNSAFRCNGSQMTD